MLVTPSSSPGELAFPGASPECMAAARVLSLKMIPPFTLVNARVYNGYLGRQCELHVRLCILRRPISSSVLII